MDLKNTLAAVSLSAAIIVIWGLFMQPSPQELKEAQLEKEKRELVENEDAPKLFEKDETKVISRENAIDESERVIFENQNVVGSISLNGAIIDDLTFKNYTISVNGNEKVTLLNPKEMKTGYYIDSGWAINNNEVDTPNNKSNWTVEGNNKLTPNNPVRLIWSNDDNITFEKIIKLDDKYLFNIEQKIINNSEKTYSFYPYGQVIRNTAPEVTNFYILHEGLLGVFDGNLVEEDYDDIEEKSYSKNAEEGYVAIVDKYWVASIVPEKNKSFRADFDYKNKFKASFIENKPTVVGANETKSNKFKVIVAAKEVDIIDGYAENQNISKFDLVIDWGWFYWLVKNLFFAIDYFYKLTGNFGIAIILITVCIRIAFFPLANMSFKSMARMKLLQPEMARLKELHKEDKVKLQQEMMALYRREKVNPLSGCFPILLQIPFFFAIYKMLFVTIEMRHQPFFGWINDLSERDPTSIFNAFGLLPFDVPNFLVIGLWPCLMGLTMYLQQKLNPAPPDPIQAKIFMFFPLFLTVILAPFPSGLVIYWTFNNIFTMMQQVVIMRKTTVKTQV